MTRRDYLLLSAAVRSARDYAQRIQPNLVPGVDVAAAFLCSALSEDNRAFDPVRFMVACGSTVPGDSAKGGT